MEYEFPTFLVGGIVRDTLLGTPSKDFDYVVQAPSFAAMENMVANMGRIYVSKPEFFTVRAKVDGRDCDFVLCRKDGTYSDGRRPDSVQIGTLLEDLARRDFTVNAMAFDTTGVLIDPFGGSDDLADMRLRCVGSAAARFNEDALRILRAIRFAVTKGFALDLSIEAAMRNPSIVSRLSTVSNDRVRDELNKALAFDTLATLVMLEQFPLVRARCFDNGVRLEATQKG